MSRRLLLVAMLTATAMYLGGLGALALERIGPAEADCMGSGPATFTLTLTLGGRTNDVDRYEFDSCADPAVMLGLSLQWDNGNKNLDLRVTEPDGTVHTVNGTTGTSEHYIHRAPLAEGRWAIEVVNEGHGAVSYGLTITFVADPDA